MKLINEHELGICKMVDSLEDAYLESCKYNGTTPEDMEYFRRYVWSVLAISKLRLDSCYDEVSGYHDKIREFMGAK